MNHFKRVALKMVVMTMVLGTLVPIEYSTSESSIGA